MRTRRQPQIAELACPPPPYAATPATVAGITAQGEIDQRHLSSGEPRVARRSVSDLMCKVVEEREIGSHVDSSIRICFGGA
jgi:hypothetical protein